MIEELPMSFKLMLLSWLSGTVYSNLRGSHDVLVQLTIEQASRRFLSDWVADSATHALFYSELHEETKP